MLSLTHSEKMIKISAVVVYVAIHTLASVNDGLAFSVDHGSNDAVHTTHSHPRRAILNSFTSSLLGGVIATSIQPQSCAAATRDVTITLGKPGESLGVELYDVSIGNPSLPTVAVRTVSPTRSSYSASSKIQPGMILLEYSRASDVVKRIREGPYPVVLTFRNLAGGGDAISDLGTPMVTAQDALTLARQTSSDNVGDFSSDGSKTGYSITSLRASSSSSVCGIKSRRGDVLEIEYDAHLSSPDGLVYDSSFTRGTGQPYQMVLGSGDMIPGVDLGLYDMCPGDTRGLQIPPFLAYGARGNKLFQVPPNAQLYWTVKLISVQSVREGDGTTRDELEGRVDYARQ